MNKIKSQHRLISVMTIAVLAGAISAFAGIGQASAQYIPGTSPYPGCYVGASVFQCYQQFPTTSAPGGRW
jgi:hypothetical protein